MKNYLYLENYWLDFDGILCGTLVLEVE